MMGPMARQDPQTEPAHSPGVEARPVICCDLDGVLWRGDVPIPGSAEGVARLRRAGYRVTFVTNNSGATTAELCAKLARFGVDVGEHDVISSALVAADYLVGALPPGASVMACAGEGVRAALLDRGFVLSEEKPAAVVVGWHRTFDFDGLTRAADAIRAGALFVATNMDATHPIGGGLLPGNGAIVAAVAAASGVSPTVTGKPEWPTVETMRSRIGPDGVMVGDRPSTDGALADALGWPFALVLSGVTSDAPAVGGERVPDPPPRWVVTDFGAFARRVVDAGELGEIEAAPTGPRQHHREECTTHEAPDVSDPRDL